MSTEKKRRVQRALEGAGHIDTLASLYERFKVAVAFIAAMGWWGAISKFAAWSWPIAVPTALLFAGAALLLLNGFTNRTARKTESHITSTTEAVLGPGYDVLATAQAQLKKRTKERDDALQAVREAKKGRALERINWIARTWAGDPPTITIRSAAYGKDYELVSEIQKAFKEHAPHWTVELDGTNNPMLPQAGEFKVVCDGGQGAAFKYVAMSLGEILDVPTARKESDRSGNDHLIIEVLPSDPRA